MSLKVLLTGATGFIGGAVARALLARGHDVLALVRDASVPRLPAGATPLRADLRAPDLWTPALAGCDAAVHAAYGYDAAGREVAEADETAVRALLGVLAHGSCRVLYTSNAFLLPGTPVREADVLPAGLLRAHPRLEREQAVAAAGGAVIRVGVVYGGYGGTMAMLFDALAGGGSDPLAGCTNRWSLIYLEDLAALYCALVEQRARGVYHGVDGVPLATGDVIARTRVALATIGASADGAGPAARALLGSYRHVLARDIAVGSERARALGWRPRFASYLEGADAAARDWQAARAPAAEERSCG